MAMAESTRAAELEREVEEQRHRVESRIDEIQQRFSPGQMVDELLTYAKGSGGSEFVSNLSHNLKENPLPVALLGVSLVWLMMGNKLPGGHSQARQSASDASWDDRLTSNGQYAGGGQYYGADYDDAYEAEYESGEQYPYETIKGGALQRVSHTADAAGKWYSEFVDDAGRKFRAVSDQAGNRAGHFTDETGKIFSGFVDETGRRVDQFRDEAGNLLSNATEWASHVWQDLTQNLSAGRRKLQQGISSGRQAMGSAGSDMKSQADQLSRTIFGALQDQPLVAGALAFAAGAALGAAVPHTRQEDQLFGETADQIKGQAGQVASELYAKGKDQVADVYEDMRGKVGEAYESTKAKVEDAVESARSSLTGAAGDSDQDADDEGDDSNTQGGTTRA